MNLAYFLTFSTYGTWLHGNGREEGGVDRCNNRFSEPYLSANPFRESIVQRLMTEPPYSLNAIRRKLVCAAIANLAEQRNWMLHAVHVRSNHLHPVVSAAEDPACVMTAFKAAASKELNSAGCDKPGRKRWTRHGSTLYLWSEESVAEKIDYVLNHQGPPGLLLPQQITHTRPNRADLPTERCPHQPNRARRY